MTGLASVTTNVGQCSEVLRHGEAGILVPPRDPSALSEALVSLLMSDTRRQELGVRLREHVREQYGEQAAMDRIEGIYQVALGGMSGC